MTPYLIRLRIHINKDTGNLVARWSEEQVAGGESRRVKMNLEFADFVALGAYFNTRFPA